MKFKIMIMALLLVSVGIGSAVNRLPATEFVGNISYVDSGSNVQELDFYADPSDGDMWTSISDTWSLIAGKYVDGKIVVGPSSDTRSFLYDYATDGVDDEVQINAALTAVGKHGVVYLKNGIYNITTPIIIDGYGISLIGEGMRGTKIYKVSNDASVLANRTTSGDDTSYAVDAAIIVAHPDGDYGYNNRIYDLTIRGDTSPANDIGYGIYAPYSSYNDVQNVHMLNVSYGYYADSTNWYNSLKNVWIHRCDTGVYLYPGGITDLERVYVAYPVDYGFFIRSAHGPIHLNMCAAELSNGATTRLYYFRDANIVMTACRSEHSVGNIITAIGRRVVINNFAGISLLGSSESSYYNSVLFFDYGTHTITGAYFGALSTPLATYNYRAHNGADVTAIATTMPTNGIAVPYYGGGATLTEIGAGAGVVITNSVGTVTLDPAS